MNANQIDELRKRMLSVERVTGKRCKWLVTYRVDGKPKYDGLYEAQGKTPAEVEINFVKLERRATDILVWER